MTRRIGTSVDSPRSALRRRRAGWLAGALWLSLAGPALPLDEVVLRAPGVSDGLLRQLRASSLVLEAQAEGRTGPVDLLAAARAEYGRLIGLLYEEGHFAPSIRVRIDGREAADIAPLRTPARIGRIEIDIEPGPQFSFGRTEVAPLAAGTALPEDFAPGRIARSTVIRDAAGAALDGWRAQGHALAAPAGQEIVAVHPDRRLDVALRLAPGPRLRFGALRPRGAPNVRPDRILAIAGLPAGEVYSPAQIAAAETRLRRTGTFASVALRTAEAANPDGSIDIDALLEEAPPRRLGAGAELDTETGLGLTGFWLHRNLLGGAERLRFEAALSGIGARNRGLGYALDLRYTRPATGRPDTDLELGLRAARTDERDFEADTARAEIRLTRTWTPELSGTLALGLRYERAALGRTRALRTDFGAVSLEAGLTRDTRDRPLDPTRGQFLTGTVTPYYGFLGADSGLHLRLDARQYLNASGDGRVVLAGRAQLGAVLGPELARTPREFLFYSGGGGTVRGLPFQSLGVAQPAGDRSGGQGFAALSAEARVRVSPSFGLAAFADAGFVSEGPFRGASDWHAGAGIGIRYLTPIGPLRLDLATPVRRNADPGRVSRLQVYVGIGQAF